MDNKFIYNISNYDKQNYPFWRFNYWEKSVDTIKFYKLIRIKVHKGFRAINERTLKL